MLVAVCVLCYLLNTGSTLGLPWVTIASQPQHTALPASWLSNQQVLRLNGTSQDVERHPAWDAVDVELPRAPPSPSLYSYRQRAELFLQLARDGEFEDEDSGEPFWSLDLAERRQRERTSHKCAPSEFTLA